MSIRNQLVLAFFLTALLALSAAADFVYKAEMTISGYSGSTTLQNFPVLVRLSPDRISGFKYSLCQADGKDIQFTSPDGETVYPHEIDTWNPDGESLIWVNVAELSGTETKMMFWFSDPELEAGHSSRDAWINANGGFYALVWHFKEEIEASEAETTLTHDSALHFDDWNMDGEPGVSGAGKFEDMVSCDGAIGLGRVNARDTSTGAGLMAMPFTSSKRDFGITDTITFSGWYNLFGKGMPYYLAQSYASFTIKKLNSVNPNGLEVWGKTDSPKLSSNTCLPNVMNEWFHLTVVISGTTATVYTNGALSISGPIVAMGQTQYQTRDLGFTVGNIRKGGNYSLNGAYDEVRVLSSAASPDWIRAEYETAVNADYLTYGAAGKAAGDDSLMITATPEPLAGDLITPTYGTITSFSGPIDLVASTEDVVVSDVLHVAFRGWELQRMDGDGNWYVVDSGETNAYRYVHESGCSDKFVWKLVRRHPISLAASPSGSGSFLVDGVPAQEGVVWVDEDHGPVTIAPVSATGYDFIWWGASHYGSTASAITVSVVPGEVVPVVATFLSNGTGHEATTVGWGGGSGSWLDAANWAGGAAPQKGDTVLLTNAAVKVVTLTDPLPRLAKLVITNATLIVSNWFSRIEADEIVVGKGGTIKVAGFLVDGAMSNRVWLVGNKLTVAEGGSIVADGAGYAGYNGPAWAGVNYFLTKDRTACGIYGGAYGGQAVSSPPHSYGDARFPEQPGSGPGTSRELPDPAVGAGGGAIRLDFTDDVIVDGGISALGAVNENSVYGSGGAVWITCRTISGAGTVDVSGCKPTTSRRCFGGGGRLAVHYDPSVQSNVTCRVVFTAAGGAAGDMVGVKVFEPGKTILFSDYARSSEDYVFATDPGSLYFSDNQFLFSPEYREMGLPFAGAWHSDEPLSKIEESGDLTLNNTCLQFLRPIELVVGGNLTMTGFGYYARRNYGLILEGGTVRVGGNLSIAGARIEMRGGELKVAGDVNQTALSDNGGKGVVTRFAGGELALKAAPTNAPHSYGATLEIGGTWHMADKAVTCPFAEPHNGAVVLMKAANLTLDEGASIDASEKGWYMGEGPGISVDKYNLMGSSYGGEGGCADKDGKIPPPTYGSRRNPVDPGSGGEHSTYPHSGCDGGGVVLLNVARTFVFNGLVTADGNTMFVSTYARGSSGGTVNIVAGKILGSSGRIRAQGGFSHQTGRSSYGSVGGGGRVAVRYSSTTWTKEMMDAATCVLPGGAYGEEDNHFGATEGTSFWKPLDGLMLRIR